MEDLTDLYKGCFEQFGPDMQYDMLIEECAELIQAISHIRRERIGLKDLASEIADVELMIGEIKYMYDAKLTPSYPLTPLIEAEKAKKIKRIRQRITKRKAENERDPLR